ncbi:MAG: ATP-binding cassette domain-containing protein, partial [Desulfobacterales bacterium]
MNQTVFEIDRQFVFQHKQDSAVRRWLRHRKGVQDKTWKLDLTSGNGTDLTISKGFVAILGASGAGKSSLLSVLSGFERLSPDQRRCIRYYDKNGQRTYADKGFGAFRKQTFGYIFQRCYESKPLSAIENIAMPLFIKKFPANTIHAYAKGLLSFLNLNRLANASANELSGGQLTRIGILRGIAQTPRVLFADEPANNLDSQNADKILMILDRWRK